MPEGVHGREGVGVGGQKVRAVCEDREEEPMGNAVVQESADPAPQEESLLTKEKLAWARETLWAKWCWEFWAGESQ